MHSKLEVKAVTSWNVESVLLTAGPYDASRFNTMLAANITD